jgi:YigZ family protein
MDKKTEFYTIRDSSTAEIIEKKSRFIANAYHVDSREEAENKINELKKKYFDAKHNCFAFSIIDENDNLLEKSSDDGEPSGTAGAPILNVIRKNNLHNILIVVTRYFGGILLGTGGLTRVYSSSTEMCIQNSKLICQAKGSCVEVEISYSDNEKFKYYCEKNNIKIVDSQYSESILYKIEINDEEYQELITKNSADNKKITFNIKSYKRLCRKFVEKVI